MGKKTQKLKKENKSNLFGKVLGLAGAGLIGLLAVNYTWNDKSMPVNVAQNLQSITLQQAKLNPNLRQAYLDQFSNSISNCAGIFYDSDGSKIINFYAGIIDQLGQPSNVVGPSLELLKGGNYDIKTPSVVNLTEKGNSVPIYVGRQLFESKIFSYCTDEDVRHILVAHEGEHCRQHSKGLSYLKANELMEGLDSGQIRSEVVYNLFEMDAYNNDLPRIINGEYKVSKTHELISKMKFITTGHALTLALSNASPLESRVINEVFLEMEKKPELRDVSIPSTDIDKSGFYKIK